MDEEQDPENSSLPLSAESLRDILPVSMGGSGKQKALALIGDRLLDLKLYESLFLTGEEREGWMTQKRSMLVSNENLSRYGSDMLIPSILSRKEYNLLSTHEKGTVVEAYIGALYVQEGYTIPRILTNLVNKIILTLQSYLAIDDHISSLSSSTPMTTNPSSLISPSPSPSSHPTHESTLLLKSQYKPPADRKKAKSTLLEVLQKRGVTKATTFFTTWSIENPNFPPFISKFEPNFDLIHCNLPDPGPVIGEICPSKKEAEESVASKVLQFFRERELMVFAPPETRQLLSSTSLNPPSLPEQVAAISEKYSLSGDNNSVPSPIYSTLEVDKGVSIRIVTGGTIEEILEKAREDYLAMASVTSSNQASASAIPLSELPEPLTLPEEFKNPHKRLLDPKHWHLCSSDTLTSSSSITSPTPSAPITIYDGPYKKKFRPSSDSSTATTSAEETEEGEVVLEELEVTEAIAREREEENRRIRENLVAVRKARAMAEKKKVENFRKYATRKRE